MIRLFIFGLYVYLATCTVIKSTFHAERSCETASGYCVLQSECPGTVSDQDKILCKEQSSSGAVCCRHFKEENLVCDNPAICMKNCSERVYIGRRGCQGTKPKCCVLVR